MTNERVIKRNERLGRVIAQVEHALEEADIKFKHPDNCGVYTPKGPDLERFELAEDCSIRTRYPMRGFHTGSDIVIYLEPGKYGLIRTATFRENQHGKHNLKKLVERTQEFIELSKQDRLARERRKKAETEGEDVMKQELAGSGVSGYFEVQRRSNGLYAVNEVKAYVSVEQLKKMVAILSDNEGSSKLCVKECEGCPNHEEQG